MAHSESILASLYAHRALISVLVERELKARYRGTFFGFFWSLLNPLMLLGVYTIIFTLIIPARIPSPVPYPLFLFAGLLPWLFATGTLLDSAVVLPDNGPLLRKVVCSPEVFPAVVVVSHLIHHLLALPILLVATVVVTLTHGFPFPWTWVLLPVVLAIWTVAVAGLGLAVAALAVHFRDLKDLLQNVLQLAFFMTPIVYTMDLVPQGILRRAVEFNPITPLITVYRGVAVEGRVPAAEWWGWSIVVALACWFLGAMVFTRLRDSLSETV